jgi:hypothetical protein
MILSYWWIANFGVVPLFLLAAFLFLPAALTLFFLIILVFLVFEPIPTSNVFLYFESKFIPSKLNLVKIMLWGMLFLLSAQQCVNAETIFLGKGQQKQVNLLKSGTFSIGNPEVLGYQLLPNSRKLLIKGQKIGFSDIISDDGIQKKTIQVYVLDKRSQLKTKQLINTLRRNNISFEIYGGIVQIKGIINNLNKYFLIKSLKKQKKVTIIAHLSPALRNELISIVYQNLMSLNFFDIHCKDFLIDIVCYSDLENKAIKPHLKHLKDKYKISFIHHKEQKHQNFKVKLKFIQFERIDGREFSLGAYQLSTVGEEIFSKGAKALMNNNVINLSNTSINASTIAEPETFLIKNKPSVIQVGSEIGFQVQNATSNGNQLTQTDWKFAGFKLKLNLTEENSNLILNYSSEFTSPGVNTISGSKEKSSLKVKLNKPMHLFKIAFQSNNNENKSIPWISNVPILNKVLGSQKRAQSYKHIYGFIHITDEY